MILRELGDGVQVAGQIRAEDVSRLAEEGVRCLVCNRPDDEEPGQPPAAGIRTAAERAGIAFVHLPVAGLPDLATARRVHSVIRGATGPTLAYCRTGTRSTMLWALGVVDAGEMTIREVLHRAAVAGYDLRALLPQLLIAASGADRRTGGGSEGETG
ncbi:MAG: TIGR01244 family phosphatase [Alphaproteobacteria bacterium]|nr:MAG: TIGR01244 family phosphatase [Alphaproteobacteria bacterium]